jgi:hypothetical protein
MCSAFSRSNFHISEISTSQNSPGVIDSFSVESYNRFAKAFHHLSLGQHGK